MGNTAEDTDAGLCLGRRFSKGRLYAKANFFLLYGASAIVLPTLSVYGRHLGLNAASVGLALTVAPFIILLVRPLIGKMADHLQTITLVLNVVLVMEVVGLFVLTATPPIEVSEQLETGHSFLTRLNIGNVTSLPLGMQGDVCVSNLIGNSTVQCTFTCPCSDEADASVDPANHLCTGFGRATVDLRLLEPTSIALKLLSNDSELKQNLRLNSDITSSLVCDANCSADLSRCLASTEDPHTIGQEFLHYQFWVFMILLFIIRISISTAFSLSDTACFEALGSAPQDYAMQRLWGTLGWGIVATLSGLLIDTVNAALGYSDHTPGLYLAAALIILQTGVGFRWNLKTAKKSRAVLKNVGPLLKKPRHLCFLLDIFVVGCCSSVHWYYSYWYFTDFKASKLLMGLTLATQSLLGDLPFMFISGWLIGKLKHINVVRLAFLGFFVKFLAYSYLRNPWYAIAIELLQGPTYGSFYVAMTSYARSISPPGTEATFLSLILGVFDCLGVAMGSFLGGMGVNYWGTRQTYFVASFVPLVWLSISVLLHLLITRCLSPEKGAVEVTLGKEHVESGQPFIAARPSSGTTGKAHTNEEQV